MAFQRDNILKTIFEDCGVPPTIWMEYPDRILAFKKNILKLSLKIVESHLAPGWNYRIYIGLLIIPVLAICRSLG